MLKLVLFFAFLAAAALGFSWLADHNGAVAVDWLGYRTETDVMTVGIAIAVLILIVMAVVAILRGVWNTPSLIGAFFERRRRERGWRALSQGMIAVGAGDPSQAGRLAIEARRILGDEPLALLLEAQAAQLTGDRDRARAAFERMAKEPDTRLLGLRGLYVEASRYGEAEAARHFAEEAHNTQPRIGWAGQALLEFQAQTHDWEDALATIDRNARNKVIDKAAAKRLRAVALTALAGELEQGEPERAKNLAMEAHGLAPELVPASVLAARLLARGGDVRKAARVIESTWRLDPHPDLARAYAYLRPGDSVQDRLTRIRELGRVRANHPEGAFAIAWGSLDAGDFDGAHTALKPLIAEVPTRRVCLLMAEIETRQHADRNAARGWLARAVRAPRDPAWVADGFVSDTWMPVSPTTGKLDAFEWKVPPESLTGDDHLLAIEEEEIAPPAASAKTIELGAGPSGPSAPSPATPSPAEPASAAQAAPEPEPVKAAPKPAAAEKVVISPKSETMKPVTPGAVATDGAASRPAIPPVGLNRAPDDPGPAGADVEEEEDTAAKRFRLFS
jgi:HemY protein